MFDFSRPVPMARLFLLASAVLHLVVIALSMGGYLVAMIAGAVLWVVCAFLLTRGNRWIAGLVFSLALFGAVTLPLAWALNETGWLALALFGIVAADLGAALMLFLALWRSKAKRPASSVTT